MLRRIKHFLQLKGLNFDVMFIEQVVVVYNTVNEFAASDEKIKYSFYIPIIIDLSRVAKHPKVIFFVNPQADHPLLVGAVFD